MRAKRVASVPAALLLVGALFGLLVHLLGPMAHHGAGAEVNEAAGSHPGVSAAAQPFAPAAADTAPSEVEAARDVAVVHAAPHGDHRERGCGSLPRPPAAMSTGVSACPAVDIPFRVDPGIVGIASSDVVPETAGPSQSPGRQRI
ncbi:MAG: hypothetical protein ACT4QF_04815 [Sporichthyaceae bacterium]